MTKFYQTMNAARAVEILGKQVVFEATEYLPATNSTWGVYLSDDAAEIAALDALVALGKIYEITEREYVVSQQKKKKLGGSPSLIEFKQWHAPQIGGQSGPDAQAAVTAEPESVEEVLAPQPATKSTKNTSKR